MINFLKYVQEEHIKVELALFHNIYGITNGNAYRDVDMTNHGNSKTHPEYPHEHTWNWSDGIPKRSK